jgi:hypothetical protein
VRERGREREREANKQINKRKKLLIISSSSSSLDREGESSKLVTELLIRKTPTKQNKANFY